MSLDVYLMTGGLSTYRDNITHNLGRMAKEAGVYKHLWRPEEIGVGKASEMIEPLKRGLDFLLSNPDWFREFNPPNGWGSYETLVEFVSEYLEACQLAPNTTVEVWR